MFMKQATISCALILFLWGQVTAQASPKPRFASVEIGGTAIIGIKGDFDSFNELNAADADALQVIQHMLFMTLTRHNASLEIVPYLARAWEFSEDGKILTYHLRTDIFWSDGVPTTARDVAFTYQLATHPKVAYPASSRFDLTRRVQALNDSTVKFYFKRAYPEALLDTQMPILPAHILEKVPVEQMQEAAFNRRPVTNGPFRLRSWLPNQKLVFEANPDFAAGPPRLQRVIFVIVPDEAVLLTHLLSGEVDLVPACSPNNAPLLLSDNRVRAVRYPGREFTFVAWNFKNELFTPKVRQALTYALNRQEILKTVLNGYGRLARGPFMPFVWAYWEDLPEYNYNLNKARELLREDGWRFSASRGLWYKNERPLEFSLKLHSASQQHTDTAILMQAQWRKLGVKVQLEPVAWNLLIRQVLEERDFDAVLLAWDSDFGVNPAPLWHSSAIESGYNFIGYKNAAVDSLIEHGRAAANPAQAMPYWIAFQRLLLRDCPYSFLYLPDKLAGVNRRLRGVKLDVRGFLANVCQWWIPRDARR
ncbi:MAG: hypothetical protein D6814_03860 [Calditrichaeota bacterium]|nr:MAG: hypothetical protein D6814_03860 [Calditrichota bacterium]